MASHSRANPDAVYVALTCAATWPLWSPIDAAAIAGGGDPEGQQKVGDTGIFRTGRVISRETIIELITHRRFVYENLSGPFRFYRCAVELAPASQGGTNITWSGSFEPKLRFSGRVWCWYLTRFMQRMADGLAAYASDTHFRTGSK